MFKNVKRHLKNERGLTLIELLAVVVILGIIAAIAVPSIGGLINNSKKDAHIANAQMMVSAARMAVTEGSETKEFSLKYLVDEEFLEPVTNPSDKGKYDDDSSVTIGEGSNMVVLKKGSFEYLNGDPQTIKRKDVKVK
ncbi:type II secretion system protein [Pseudogracilibacillus auburnensis]|uniref:type II secretion system protein n=1 Tax=Pseudogracilibacillus auburnensis TaxID=1494959 RepID=UPI001A979559|nr:type II secretion system protein [Pseudogracilibacillus auburnensis]MBO1005596.1 type II secretion system protein [Pseudogracilibacillus auburnensis]